MKRITLAITAIVLVASALSAQTTQTFVCSANSGSACSSTIPDFAAGNNGVRNSTLVVPANPCGAFPNYVSAVRVSANVTHDYVGDLRLRVTSPASTSVILLNRPSTCGSDDINTTFQDGGATFPCAPSIPASGTAPVAPFQPLSIYAGLPNNGTWTLQVVDFANTGIGMLNSWSLITVCDTYPSVTITAIDDGKEQAGDTMLFRITRSAASSSPLVVNFAFSGTATPGTDFTPNTTSVTIPAGQASADLVLNTTVDSTNEPTETVIVTVQAGPTNTVGSPSSAQATIADASTVPPGIPTGVVATGTNARVDISWTPVTHATSYQIDRREAGTGFSQVGTSVTASFSDTTTVTNKSYEYRVRAIDAQGASGNSASSLATTITFIDALIPGSTLIKATHLSQLRTAVNAVRALAGLPPATFTGPATAGTTVRAIQVTELRTRLDEALGPLGYGTGGYTDPTLTGVVKAVHFQELRNRVK